MPPSVTLLFGVHSHQPVGNFAHIFKKANQDCYRPFIETLYRYPDVQSTLHFSGSLIDWLLNNDPELLQKVKRMVKHNQVEILTGGYFEPILPIIPEKDIFGQINMLSNFIKDYFAYEPKGAWIGERVWEPYLVKPLKEAGVKYILLDDFHFRSAGINEGSLRGYYLTEEEGRSLAVFPISKKLRYIIPFSSPAQPIAFLKSLSQEGGAATIVDDAEKFGLWPGTQNLVYRERWLEKFFQLLIKSKDWLKTQTITEYMSNHKPLGRCQLPGACYEEMMSWSGGSFKNFFIKYPEANNLHKRMLYVSEREKKGTGYFSKEKSVRKSSLSPFLREEARRYLYMGQSNCPYWHGVFGGIYLGHLRHTAYKNLITAQSLLEQKKESRWIEIEVFDFDQDGVEELILKNPVLDVFVAPKLGGGIFELDYKPKCVNLMDVMTRRPESYHKNIDTRKGKRFKLKHKTPTTIHDLLGSKEKGLEDFLIYDTYRRLSLLDHFFSLDLSFQDWKNSCYEELGDFINGQYLFEQKRAQQGICLSLQREGKINQMPLRISKALSINNKDAQIYLEYKLDNLSAEPLEVVFAVEFNISPENQTHPNNLRCNAESVDKIYSLEEDVQAKAVRKLLLQDITGGIETTFYFDKNPNLWAYPLQTISASESGFERNYQQTVILPYWLIRLEESWQTKITLTLQPLP